MIAPFATDQTGAPALAARRVVGQRDLQRAIHRFRAGIGEEDAVHALRKLRGDPVGELESLGVPELKAGRIVQLVKLRTDRFANFWMVMSRVDAPQPRGRVEDRPAVFTRIVHPIGGLDHPRAFLERAVGGERHPKSV